jgi:hypothetical protein
MDSGVIVATSLQLDAAVKESSMSRWCYLFALVALMLGACSDEVDPPKYDGIIADAARDAGPDFNAPVDKIQDIFTEKIKDGKLANLKGVVVLAVDGYAEVTNRTGSVWVQDPAGGPQSAMLLYKPTLSSGKNVLTLKPGDVVDVKGQVKHHKVGDITSPECPNKTYIYELDTPTITVKTTGNAAPTPSFAKTLKELYGTYIPKCADLEKYENQLVTFKDVKVTRDPDSVKAVDYVLFDAVGIAVSNLYDFKPKLGDCLSITGIWQYWISWKVMPRDASDIKVSTGCKAPTPVTFKQLHDATDPKYAADLERVKVSGVVTAVDSTTDSFGVDSIYIGFVVQDPAGGKSSGILVNYVWKDTAAASRKPKLNEQVELTGTVVRNSAKVTSLFGPIWIEKGAATPVSPAAVSATAISPTATTAQDYVGMLVKVTDVEVDTYLESGGTKYGFNAKGSGLAVDNWFFDFMGSTPPSAGTKYTSVTGVVIHTFGEWRLVPRSAADLVK